MKLLPFNRRGIYLLDGAGSLALGLLLIGFAAPLAAAGGSVLSDPVLFWIGVLLVPWAGFNVLIGMGPEGRAGAMAANVAGDVLWVVASIALLTAAGTDFTAAGAIAVGTLAAGVGAVGLVKFSGLRSLRRSA